MFAFYLGRQRIEQPAPQRPNADQTGHYTKSPTPQDGFRAGLPKKED